MKRAGLLFSSKYTAAIVPHCQNLILPGPFLYIGDPEQSIKACHTDGTTQHLLLSPRFICTCLFSISIRLLKRGRQLEGQCNGSSQALPICSAVLKHHILQVYPSLNCEKMCLDMHDIKGSEVTLLA